MFLANKILLKLSMFFFPNFFFFKKKTHAIFSKCLLLQINHTEVKNTVTQTKWVKLATKSSESHCHSWRDEKSSQFLIGIFSYTFQPINRVFFLFFFCIGLNRMTQKQTKTSTFGCLSVTLCVWKPINKQPNQSKMCNNMQTSLHICCHFKPFSTVT